MMMWNNAFDEDNTSEDIEELTRSTCTCKLKRERASCKAFSRPEADPEPIVGYDTLRVCTLWMQ
jgi:hypothetical protein